MPCRQYKCAGHDFGIDEVARCGGLGSGFAEIEACDRIKGRIQSGLNTAVGLGEKAWLVDLLVELHHWAEAGS